MSNHSLTIAYERKVRILMGSSSETQERILATAIKHFAKNGYYGAKTADIAKDSGVAEGTVFKYYNTKKDILRGVLNKIIHEIIPGIVLNEDKGFLKDLESNRPREAVRGFIKGKLTAVNENIDAFKILINELQYHDDIKEEYLGQFIPKVISSMESFYMLGVQGGIFRDMNPHIAARSFLGMLNMIVLETNVLNRNLDLDRELDSVLDIYLNGVGIRKEG